MKKIILAIIAVIIASVTPLQAQGSHWGVVAGATYNEIHFKQTDIFDVNRGLGATVGLMGELMLPGIGFGFETGLTYTLRSSKLHMGDREVWKSLGLGDENVMLHYIDVPVLLKFKYMRMNGFENTLAPIAYGGPVFSFLAGHSKVNNEIDYNTFNIGVRAGVGVELFNKVQVSVNYTFSIGEALRTRLLDSHGAKNRCWGITAVYLF